MDDVHSQLTVTDIHSARTEPLDDFDVIVTVCQDDIADHVPEDVTYCFFNMSDGESDSYGGDCCYSLFDRAASTVLNALQDGERLLVHCHMGQSRSATVSIAALAVYEGVTYRAARNVVADERPQIHPHTTLERFGRQFVEENSS